LFTAEKVNEEIRKKEQIANRKTNLLFFTQTTSFLKKPRTTKGAGLIS